MVPSLLEQNNIRLRSDDEQPFSIATNTLMKYFLIIFVGLYLRARIFVLKDSLDSLDFATSGSRRFREDPDGTILLKLCPESGILLVLSGLLLASGIVFDKPGEVLGIVDLLAEHALAALAEYALALVCWHSY